MPPLNLYARVRISLRTLRTRPRVQRAPRHSLHPLAELGCMAPRERAAMSFCKARRALNEPVITLSYCAEREILAGELGFPTKLAARPKCLICRRFSRLPTD